jgi:hypothetical protein
MEGYEEPNPWSPSPWIRIMLTLLWIVVFYLFLLPRLQRKPLETYKCQVRSSPIIGSFNDSNLMK